MGDSEGVIEVAESVKLPLLPLDCDEELLDSFQRQLVTLHQDADRVRHELAGHLQDLVRQRRRDQAHLNYTQLRKKYKQCCALVESSLGECQCLFQYHLSGRGKISVDIVDLLLEPLVQHLVGLVQHQHLDPAGSQGASADHVKHSARSSRDDVLPIIQFPDVLPKVGAPNA